MDVESSVNQPSTSEAASVPLVPGNDEGEEKNQNMAQLLEATDKILENKAKSLNLSSLNVRSILHHLIKYPSTIDVLLGIRENDGSLPSVRNMRSRKKQDEPGTSSAINTPEKFSLRIEDKGPKNFLDLEYEEDDEYDEDYVEENISSRKDGDEAAESDDEEMDEEEEGEEDDDEDSENEGEVDGDQKNISHSETADDHDSSGIHENNELADLLFEDVTTQNDDYSLHMTLNDTRPGSAALVQTLDNVVDDDDYRNFVKSINFPAKEYVLDKQLTIYDTEDDTEDEDYNVIADNLNVEDWDETRQDKTTLIPRHEVKALMMDTLLAEKDIPVIIFPSETMDESRKQQRPTMNEVKKCENRTEAQLNESCSLLTEAPVTFRPEEIKQLRTQLEQHVQLLTQFVVTCHHDDALAHVRNSAQIMMNELDDIRQQRYYQTVLDTDNLDAAIESCHEINTFPPVSNSVLNYTSKNDWNGGMTLRPEAAEVLSKSSAIRYPKLLPPCQPVYIQKTIPFLYEEDIMLAVALLQFSHLPRRAEKNTVDRYSMIQQHCLPAREAFKIRNHLKTMRKASNNPIHEIVQAAENGICKISMPCKEWKRIETPIHAWPVVSQPAWYRVFTKTFNVTEDRQIHRKEDATMVLTPRKCTSNVTNEEDIEDFVDIGTGSDGRQIIMARESIEELMKQLKEEKSASSKRRKNPTPMKLSTMIEMEKDQDREQVGSLPSTSTNQPTTSTVRSKAARRLDCTRDPDRQKASKDNPSLNRKMSLSRRSCTPPSHDNYEEIDFGQSVQNHRFSRSSRIRHNLPGTSKSSDLWELHDSPEDFHHMDNKSNSCNSFPIPPTPGRRSPDEHDDFFMDLETNSLVWSRPPHSVYMGNPQTPRGYSVEPDYNEDGPIDFSSMVDYEHRDRDVVSEIREPQCQRPMGYSAEIDEFSNPDSNPDAQYSPSSDHGDAPVAVIDNDVDGTGLEHADEAELNYGEGIVEEIEEVEEPPVKLGLTGTRPPLRFAKLVAAGNTNIKASRKRTMAESEAMASVGFYDEAIYEKQKDCIMRKVIEDISQRLFMHKDTLQQFQETIFNEEFSEIEKVSRIMLVLKNHRELLSLILLYAPPEAIVSDYELNSSASSYKAAVEMIMAIQRYVTSSQRKSGPRPIFSSIQNFLVENPNLSDEEAAKKFHQLFARDGPLWQKIESNFWCLPYRPKAPPVQQFEYIDLTNLETMTKKDLKNINSRFETIDGIDNVMSMYRPTKTVPSKLVVKAGEFCIQNDDESLTQLEVTERHWTMKDDVSLLKGYNEAVKKIPDFQDVMILSFVPDLQFGPKSIVARLKYLLEELKKMEEEGEKKD